MTENERINQAVADRRAVLRWSHGNWENVALLVICDTPEAPALEAERDTRGHCYSMADEVWSELCTDPARALKAHRGLLVQR